MNYIRLRFILFIAAAVIGLAGFGYAAEPAQAAGSASLYLTPASGSYATGQSVSVKVMVNTGSEPVNAVMANLSYPAGMLQFQSIDGTGSGFGIDANSSGSSGTVKLARGATTNVTGTALIATVHFHALAAGSATLSFLSSSAVVSSTSHTNILAGSVGATFTVSAPATAASSAPTATANAQPASQSPAASATPQASSSVSKTTVVASTTSPKKSGNSLSPLAVGLLILALLALVAFIVFRHRHSGKTSPPDQIV